MSFFDTPTALSRKDSYFAALNSHRGFVSFFPTLFAPYRKYVIKGGPGSGKSTLMKKIALAAEEKALAVERYYCSSDTDSLDAVAIPALNAVILDGTPPHTTEPENPGAHDTIINLFPFWNISLLKERSDTVAELNAEIGKLYRRGYELMRAVNSIETAIGMATESAFDVAGAEKIVNRLLEKYRIAGTGEGKAMLRPASAFGVKGYVALDSYEQAADTLIYVKDRGAFSECFFKVLEKALLQRGVSFYISPRPVDETAEAVFLPEKGILFTRHNCEDRCDGVINLDRMLPDRGRGALRGQKGLLREADTLCEAIQALLAKAGSLHSALEEHYIAATDYSALNDFTAELLAKLFG